MKKLRFPISALLFSAAIIGGCASTQVSEPAPAVDDPTVVARIGGEAVTLNTFEQQYAKSVGSVAAALADSPEDYRAFLERYVVFRMKVAEARKAGLADDPGIEEELATYRRSIARPYLLEHEVLEPLMRRLYARMQDVVNTSHLLIRVDADASPADTIAAYQRTAALRDSLLQGADFSALAERYSEDPSAQMAESAGYQGLLGYLPAGATVEPFETMMFETGVGEISPIFRTQFGYHVLRVNDRQPSVPDRRVAHISVRPAGASAADSAALMAHMQSLRDRIAAGEDFEELAKTQSQHAATAQNGGDAGFYMSYYIDQGTPEPFKEAAFALEKVGDVSDVVVSRYAFHLIKLLDIRVMASYETSLDLLKEHVSKLPQAQEAQAAFLDEVQQQHGLTVDSSAAFRIFEAPSVTELRERLQDGSFSEAELSTRLVTLGDSVYTTADVIDFASVAPIPYQRDVRTYVRDLVQRFVGEQTINAATYDLSDTNPEFRRTMEDFRDGLMLFRLMEDSVWAAASRDSTRLRAYFQEHEAAYRYPDRTRVISFSAASDSLLREADLAGTDGNGLETAIARVAADETSQVRVDTVHVTAGSSAIYDRALSLEMGQPSEVFQAADGRFYLLFRHGEEAARQMTFEEARGLVTTDYQGYLEEQLVSRLERVYEPQLYPERLSGAFMQAQRQAQGARISAAK